jgi:hypothetical protein
MNGLTLFRRLPARRGRSSHPDDEDARRLGFADADTSERRPMATSYDVARVETSDYDIAGSGWVTFAAVMLGLAGTFNFFDGILAVSKSKFYTHDATYVFSNLHTWGWIIMILGILQLVAAFTLFGGSEFARWFGIICASVNAIGQLMFVPALPVWSLAMFSIDVLIIYGLSVYAGNRLRA